MARVVFRPEAEADLSAISLFIAEHSVNRAKRFSQRLRQRCMALKSHPMAGRPRGDLGEGLRGLYERPYVLIYRLTGDDIEIVAILHAMRDLPAAISARVGNDPKE
jgi:toxin ParE1/3/4